MARNTDMVSSLAACALAAICLEQILQAGGDDLAGLDERLDIALAERDELLSGLHVLCPLLTGPQARSVAKACRARPSVDFAALQHR